MKWPWSNPMSPAKQQKKDLIAEVRAERGQMASTIKKFDTARFHLDELVRRSLAELNSDRGSTR